MFIVNRCKDIDGNPFYNGSSFIGIYTDFMKARIDLETKLNNLNYTYIIENSTESNEYIFIFVTHKNNKEINYGDLCFEIKYKKIELNEIKFK
jgi:hypothetical protein